MVRRGAIAWGVVLLLAGCVAVGRPPAPPALGVRPAPELQALIDPRPAPAGALAWLGGDVASSVQVGRDRWIWIFGDTLLGRVSDACPGGVAYCDRDVDDRPTHAMIANSVGVMTRRPDGTLTPLVTHWRTVDGVPAPIFAAEDPAEFLWPLALTYVDGVLLVAASRHTRAAGLASRGDVLIRVRNPDAPPARWHYDRTPVPHTRPEPAPASPADGAPLTWATELVRDAGWVYLVGRLGSGLGAATVLARFPAAGVGSDDWRLVPEYRQRRTAEDPALGWTTAFDPELLHPVPGLPGTSEATIARDARLGWYTYRIEWLSHALDLYTAPALEGPWTAHRAVYEIPPPEGCVGRIGDAGAGCAGVPYFAYAAKAHPSWAPPGTHVVSYNVNVLSADLEDALRAAEQARAFYVPRLVAVRPAGG